MNLTEHDNDDTEDVIADLVAILSAFTARLSGPRRAKCTTERIGADLLGEEAESDATG